MIKNKSIQPKFSRFRRIFFPIHNHELKKFIPMAIIFFFVCFNYALLRGLKDTFVIVLKGGGGEAIAAAKFIGVIPAMVLFKILYDEMSNRIARDTQLIVIIVYFATFFALFLFVLFPHREALEAITLTNKLMNIPIVNRFSSVLLMLRYWPITLFYIHAEAWGTFVLGVGAWIFIISITNTRQATRFFSFLSLGSGTATALAGLMVKYPKSFSIENILQAVLVFSCLLLLIYYFFVKAIAKNPIAYEVEHKAPKKKKPKLSLRESFSIVFKSPYMTCILVIVLCYALAIVFFENIYRDCFKKLAGDDVDIIRNWTGSQLLFIGILQILFLPPAGYIMQKRWRFIASILPIFILIGSLLFFALLFFGESIIGGTPEDLHYYVASTGLYILVPIKALKYIVFDSSQAMAWKEEKESNRIPGKSAVDGIGSRIGKGAGAFFITMIIVPFFGSISAVRPLFAILIVSTVLIWIWAVQDLSVRFENRKIQNKK